MIERRSWQEFREAGLLWWVNRALHLFGWAIVVELNDDGETVRDIYPAHCKFRGFDAKSDGQGFVRLTKHIIANADRIAKEVEEDDA